MAQKYKRDILTIFNNSGVEFIETNQFKKRMVKEWGINLIETHPEKGEGYWDCIKKYGLPRMRGKGRGGSNVPRCCYYCKEKPANKIYKKLKIKAVLTGIMAEESRQRKLLITRYDNAEDEKDSIKMCGQRYYSSSWDQWKYHPIAYWKEEDVWNYIKENDIPMNEVYFKWNGVYDRCGCLPCTAYIGWERKLSKTHPKLYRLLKKYEDPQQTSILEV